MMYLRMNLFFFLGDLEVIMSEFGSKVCEWFDWCDR